MNSRDFDEDRSNASSRDFSIGVKCEKRKNVKKNHQNNTNFELLKYICIVG